MTSPALPSDLRDSVEHVLRNVPQEMLAARVADMSAAYRAGHGSNVTIRDSVDVAAYLAARLPATYAAMIAALDCVAERAPDFAPETLLDFGAGPGTASWAATQIWPVLRAVTMLDRNTALLACAKELAGGSSVMQQAHVQQGSIAALDPSANYDVVLAGYVFAELSKPEIERTAMRLWDACRGVLVIVEPGTPEGFERIRHARQVLLSNHAAVAAPCPGSYACPAVAPDWCHFSVRLPRSRAHMRAKGADVPFEDEKFSYVAFARDTIVPRPIGARILARPHVMKPGIRLKLCTAEGIEDRTIARRAPAYKAATKKNWGDSL